MSSGDWGLEGLCLAGLSLCAWEYVRKRGLTERLEKAYWMEHRGRLRTEMAMKKISSIQLNTDGGFFVQEIGTVASCYRQCIGTPRCALVSYSTVYAFYCVCSLLFTVICTVFCVLCRSVCSHCVLL
jgi:hypothetical protein